MDDPDAAPDADGEGDEDEEVGEEHQQGGEEGSIAFFVLNSLNLKIIVMMMMMMMMIYAQQSEPDKRGGYRTFPGGGFIGGHIRSKLLSS